MPLLGHFFEFAAGLIVSLGRFLITTLKLNCLSLPSRICQSKSFRLCLKLYAPLKNTLDVSKESSSQCPSLQGLTSCSSSILRVWTRLDCIPDSEHQRITLYLRRSRSLPINLIIQVIEGGNSHQIEPLCHHQPVSSHCRQTWRL